MGIFSAVFAGMLFVLLSGSATPAFAASAENDSVRVRCDESGIIIRAEGEDFVILAPRRDEHFQAEVLVQPLGDWELVRPTTNPFNMKGGDAQGYEAKLEPEDERSGTIFFHNYCVRSDWGDGEKDVVVPAGTTVVFTASKNGEPAPSDWTVDGVLVETNKTSYTFNAPVSEPRFLSVRPLSSPSEGLKSESYVANDSTESALVDSGSAQESGIIRISGPNSKFSEQTERSAAWAESEVIYSQPCAQFFLTATLAPDMSDDEREIILNNINWSADQGTLVPDNANPLEALHTAPAATGEYHITVSCGTSKRVILVKVAVPEIHQVSFSGNIAILRDVAQSVYPAPDWMDANMDGTSDLADANANTNKSYHPIAYLSTDKLSATGVFRPKCTKVSSTNEWIAAFDAEAAVQKLRIALDGGSWSSPVLISTWTGRRSWRHRLSGLLRKSFTKKRRGYSGASASVRKLLRTQLSPGIKAHLSMSSISRTRRKFHLTKPSFTAVVCMPTERPPMLTWWKESGAVLPDLMSAAKTERP